MDDPFGPDRPTDDDAILKATIERALALADERGRHLCAAYLSQALASLDAAEPPAGRIH